MFQILCTARTYFIFSVFQLITSIVNAQNFYKAPLKVGDSVTNVLLSEIINFDKRTANIEDFKQQLLVIDFWGRFCKACIQQFPKYEKLQSEFGNRIQILLATAEEEKIILPFWVKNPITKSLKLPSVVGDTVLSKLFPFESMPHLVWINKGVVRAITTYEYLKKDNINILLGSTAVNWPVKIDAFEYDYDAPYLTFAGNGIAYKPNPIFYSSLTGYLDGSLKWFMGLKRDTMRQYTRLFILNQPVDYLYRNALAVLGEARDLRPYTLIELKDSSRFTKPDGGMDANLTDWHRKNSYTYELIVPLQTSAEEIRKMIFLDLNRFLRLRGRFEKRMINCYILKRSDQAKKLISQEGGAQISDYLSDFYASGVIKAPIVDETLFKGRLAMNLNQTSLESLKKSLGAYGFDLVEVRREIEMLVIGEPEF